MRQAKAEIAVEVDFGGGRGSRTVRLAGQLISSRAKIISCTAVRINAASKIESLRQCTITPWFAYSAERKLLRPWYRQILDSFVGEVVSQPEALGLVRLQWELRGTVG